MIQTGNPAEHVARAFHLWAAPPRLTVSEWADAYRVLSAEGSGEPGQWRTDRAPYQRGIMDALSEPGMERVTVMSSAQVGKTEFVNNAVGFFIHQDPSPIMVVHPTVDTAKKWSKTRFAPMQRDTPVLRERVADEKSRDTSNTIQEKTFPGGLLVIVGANAPSGLASQPIRVVLCDEVDRYGASAGEEGDPVDLAFKRTTTFTGRRKLVLISTPGTKGSSRIEAAWEQSDQRRYFVPCPHCGVRQVLRFANLTWPEGQPDAAVYACSACGAEIQDSQKPAMLRAGEWVAERPQVRGHAGFHLNELYSPWKRWGEVASDFLAAKAMGVESLKVWVNTALGETWDPRDGTAVTVHALMARREAFAAEVPDGVLVLTAGVDVQDDRLEATVWGWGAGEESWKLRHTVFVGNPSLAAPWEGLDALLVREWAKADGRTLRIAGCGVDSQGHFTKQVYAFCRARAARGVFAVKGQASVRGRIVKRSKTRSILWLVDTGALKDTLAARLRVEAPGPGFMHFPVDTPQDWFEQLTAEKPAVRRQNGQTVRVWVPIVEGNRNEALDCAVYAAAALERLGIKDWSALAGKPVAASAGPPPPAPIPTPAEPEAASPPAPEPGVLQPLKGLPTRRPRLPAMGGSGWRRGGGVW